MPRVIHFEMYMDDPERGRKFYQDVFGWQFNKWTGPQEYWLVTTGEEGEPGINGGMMRPRPGQSPGTINTIGVPSLEQVIKKIEHQGWNDLCAQDGDSRCRLVGLRGGSHRECVRGTGTRYQRKIVAPGQKYGADKRPAQ
jgi:predicted enzyme related to lactoylglutathione lyase